MARHPKCSLSHPCPECKGRGPIQGWACYTCLNTGVAPDHPHPKPTNVWHGYSVSAEIRAGA